jgi:hypothetical protein
VHEPRVRRLSLRHLPNDRPLASMIRDYKATARSESSVSTVSTSPPAAGHPTHLPRGDALEPDVPRGIIIPHIRQIASARRRPRARSPHRPRDIHHGHGALPAHIDRRHHLLKPVSLGSG